jgi:hypothetical protein
MYNELCEKLSEEYANDFIAIFNELDKYFDTLVQDKTDRFMPYNEKVKLIAMDTTPVSTFVKKYEIKLKFFGELRNHLTHGFKIDGVHYATPSYHWVEELRKIKEAIVKPISIGSIYTKKVFTSMTSDLLKDTMFEMKNSGYTHVPVYNEQRQFQWVLTQSAICERLAYHMQDITKPLDSVLIQDINLHAWIERHIFVSESTPLFSVPHLFEWSWVDGKILWSLLITKNGNPDEELLWIITTYDLPAVTECTFIG